MPSVTIDIRHRSAIALVMIPLIVVWWAWLVVVDPFGKIVVHAARLMDRRSLSSDAVLRGSAPVVIEPTGCMASALPLYPTSAHPIPAIFLQSRDRDVVQWLNSCMDEIDERLDRLVVSCRRSATFQNTILPLQEPLFALRQMGRVLDFYRLVHGRNRIARNPHVRQRHHLFRMVSSVWCDGGAQLGPDDRRLTLAVLGQYQRRGTGLDRRDALRLQAARRCVRARRSELRNLLRSGSKSLDPRARAPLIASLRDLVAARHTVADLLAQPYPHEQIERHLQQAAAALRQSTLRSDWDRIQTAVVGGGGDDDPGPARPREFVLSRVVSDGLLALATDLYGLTFEERRDLDQIHPDQRVYQVSDDNGDRVGFLIFDLVRRPQKSACCHETQIQVLADRCDGLGVRDQIVLILQNQADTIDALITFDQVGDLFYHFGDAVRTFLIPNRFVLLEPSTDPVEVRLVSALVHQQLAADPVVLHRIDPALTTSQIDLIRSRVALRNDVVAVQALAGAVLAQAWLRRAPLPADDADLDQYHGAALAAYDLAFARPSAKDVLELMLSSESWLRWAVPVADFMVGRIRAAAAGADASLAALPLRRVLQERTLTDIETLLASLERPQPCSSVMVTTTTTTERRRFATIWCRGLSRVLLLVKLALRASRARIVLARSMSHGSRRWHRDGKCRFRLFLCIPNLK